MFDGPHGRNLRKGRVSVPGQPYLITTVTENRQSFFRDYRLGRIVVNTLRGEVEKGSVTHLAYVIMPDHLHWLVSLTPCGDLSRTISSVKGISSHYVAARLFGHAAARSAKTRAIWQRGFHDHALRVEEDLRNVARYMVMNPVRAGLVSSIWMYPLWDAVWIGED